MRLLKKLFTIVLLISLGFGVYGQELVLSKVNGVENPEHGNNIGSIARTDTIFVEGTYANQNIESVSIKLMTFQKSPWSKLESHDLLIDAAVDLNGVIDTFIVTPEDYILGGNIDNSQFVQVRTTYTGDDIFANLYIIVTEKPAEHKTLLDFDEVYGSSTGSTLASNVNTALATMQEGDTILFNSAAYDFEAASITISKSICFSGKIPSASESDERGAYEVITKFNNLKMLKLSSDDIQVENIELSADASTGYVFTRVSHATNAKLYYSGIQFNNVIFRNGKVQCFGGNGASVDFNHVSFLDFTQGGYFLNRSESIDEAPAFNMSKCFFQPLTEAINFNVRAISLDAGNTEYPVVWNQNNSTIDDCLMDGTGLGISSKCSYVNVTNCHFKGYRMDVDMIHIEEFGHHFLIDGNTFEHIKPARGINIDREIQQSHHITITNNTWIGEYGWIISAHSPYNLVMENNDFTQAWAKNTSDLTIDLTFDHGEETHFTEYDLPANNIVFKNNTGLDNGKHGIFAYKALADESSIEIEYPANLIQVHTINKAPKAIINMGTYYRIRNKQSGEYLRAVSGEPKLDFSAEEKTDSSDIWQFTFEYPYFYHIKNRATKEHMAVYRGYTMGDYNNGTKEQIFVEQSDFFNTKTEKPRWYLRKFEEGGADFFEILPGGNERKSRNVQVGNHMELEYAKVENRGQLPPEDDSSWELISLKADVSVKNEYQNAVKIYPNPASKVVNIDLKGVDQTVQKVDVYSSNGQLVYKQNVASYQDVILLNVEDYSTGIYYLSIELLDMRITKKLSVY
ncbi:T9SS type A sorting domain-containing protein [Labilibacter marinus]|uniref:T9SS type A sorting domain-containing protein n=1 Tax=Labilibacter marinus TaxID=1477105 RepID=UPI0009500EE5|nr:T9SS type A sorting domain-containing protein [Labilibacter marinus]